jgi:poly-gamma-glutamate synthesis protein (capsule biosynthesis protein)
MERHTPAFPAEDEAQPEITPTETAAKLYIAPYLPETITDGLVVPGTLEMTGQRDDATLWLEIGSSGTVVSNLVYALAAPFPALEDAVSFNNLKESWLGQPKGIFQTGSLYLTEQTRSLFSIWWGEPQGDFVQVVDEDALLSTTWADAPAWALLPFEQLEPRWKVLQVGGTSPILKNFDFVNYPLNVPISLGGNDQVQVEQLASAFFASVPYLANHDAGKLTTVVLTGVTALVRATATEMEAMGVLYPAEDVGPLLQEADIAHISNEVPFAANCPEPRPVNTRLIFCSSPDYMELLEYIGTDVVELTGDHFSDWGTEATLYTFDLYDAEGWTYYGGGRVPLEGRLPVTFEHNGNKIAFIGCNGKGGSYTPSTQGLPGAVDCDFDLIADQIGQLKDQGYVVIMTFQHHEIYSFTPTPNLVRDFRFTADAGADIVSGSQAHQPHGMEFYDGSTIMYGLGNLFFDQLYMGDNTTRAMIARHVIYDGRHISTEIFTVHFIDFSRPLFMDDAGRRRLLTQVFANSQWGDLTYPIIYNE